MHFFQDSRAVGTELQDQLHGLHLDEIAARIPVVTATVPHSSRTEKFVPIPTIDVLTALYADGFRATRVIQAKARTPERMLTARHLVRLRHVNDFGAVSGSVPEISMVNALDGSAAHSFFCGFIRFECFNGLICGDAFDSFKVRHIGAHAIAASRDAVARLRETFPQMSEAVARFKTLNVNAETELLMAQRAFNIRFDEDARTKMLTQPVHQLTRARRPADVGADLWSTFNRIQENVTRGGLHAITTGADGVPRRTTARAVRAIGDNVKLNRQLWDDVLELTAREIENAA
jgi:hypothetical protein